MCEVPESDDDGIILEENFSKFNLNSTTKIIPKPRPQSSCSLQHEFSLLNTNIPHIDVELLDSNKRNAMVRLSVNGHVIMLQIIFPSDYPNQDNAPDFIYCQGTSIDDHLSEQMLKVLQSTANQRVRKGRTCLEQCLRALVTAMRKVLLLFFVYFVK